MIVNRKSNFGFTIIELVIVITILSALSILGVAGFSRYNQIQTVQSAVNDIVGMINLAKSRASSQIKLGPAATCGPTHPLRQYEVKISTTDQYQLIIHCGPEPPSSNTASIINKRLPVNVTFSASISFFFPVLKAGVETPGNIVLSGYGLTKTITIDSLGGIKVL